MDSDIPPHMICPISLEIMKRPYLNKVTGQNYSEEIFRWCYFADKPTCPLTRQPLHPSDLVENKRLKREIALWRRTNRLLTEAQKILYFDDDIEDDEDEMQPNYVYNRIQATSPTRIRELRDKILKQREIRIKASDQTLSL